MKKFVGKRFRVLLLILFFTILFAITKYFAGNIVLYSYCHPMTNADVFRYLAPEIKHLNKVLADTKSYIGNDKYKITYLYKNYYGSGFLKYNPVPNDLDCSVGIYLGEFDYNGNNSDFIALNVSDKISVFYTAFFEALTNNYSDMLYNSLSPFDSFGHEATFYKQATPSFSVSLPHIFNDEDYIFVATKSPLDNKDIKVQVPFVMKKNELLLENLKPVNLYSSSVVYNTTMNNYVRQVSVIFDFFVDIKDVNSNKVKRIEIVPEAFLGSRLQLSKRLFVPSCFDGINSYVYMQRYSVLKDEKLYLDTRIYNLMRYVDLVQTNAEQSVLPIKMLKRLHQGIDAFSPLLTQDEKNEFYKTISFYLNDDNVVYLNDIQNIFYMLHLIAEDKKALNYCKSNSQLSVLSKVFDKDLLALKKTGLFDIKDLNKLDSVQKELVKKMFSTKTDEDFYALSDIVKRQQVECYKILKKMYNKTINIKELLEINSVLESKFIKAGFVKKTMYWLDDSHIGFIKDESMINCTEQSLKNFAIESGLPNVNYKFIKKSDVDNLKNVHSNVWIRLTPTNEQNNYYEHMKKALLNDRKNYSIKSKIYFVP